MDNENPHNESAAGDAWHDVCRCPATRQPLRLAEAGLVARLNAHIAAKGLVNRSGNAVHEAVEEALVTQDGAWAYPVRGGIPVLLRGEALPVPE